LNCELKRGRRNEEGRERGGKEEEGGFEEDKLFSLKLKVYP
jgi:hypothetical protein